MTLIFEIAIGYLIGSVLRSLAAAILTVVTYKRSAGKRDKAIAEYRKLLDKLVPEKRDG